MQFCPRTKMQISFYRYIILLKHLSGEMLSCVHSAQSPSIFINKVTCRRSFDIGAYVTDLSIALFLFSLFSNLCDLYKDREDESWDGRTIIWIKSTPAVCELQRAASRRTLPRNFVVLAPLLYWRIVFTRIIDVTPPDWHADYGTCIYEPISCLHEWLKSRH